MATTTHPVARKGGMRLHVQRFGTFLSNMVLPNIGAFIAWGLITALFIETGWITLIGDKLGYAGGYGFVEDLGAWGHGADAAGIVGPMITYLLPLLIGYTGGRMMYDDNIRGGVVGAIATMGAITGASVPMFLGAMVMGPLAGWSMKKLDALWSHKIRPGFEMLVNNFSAGIWGGFLAIIGFVIAGPFVQAFSTLASNVVDYLVDHHLLPLTSIFIEPAKILFLNNAINQGILTPLGTTEAQENGKSILFLLEANPGPGLGLLLAFAVFGKGIAKASAPGAIIIQFLGGIHEIYFPYVLMKPKLVAAVILGGMTGVATNVVFGSGLRSPASPGSIIAVWAAVPPSSFIGVTLSVVLAATVSFLVASFLLKLDKNDDGDLTAATAEMEAHKGKKSSISSALVGSGTAARHDGPIHSIVFACDAGMGSSAMGASVLRKKVQGAGLLRRHGGEQGHLQPDRHLRPRRHPRGPDRARRAEDRVGRARVGVELHGQPALRRDRRAAAAHQRDRWRRRRCGRPRNRTGVVERGQRVARGRQHRPGRRPAPAGTRRSRRPASCWSGPARSTPRTCRPCTSGSSRCRPTWATCWPSRTAPTRPSRASGTRRSRSSATRSGVDWNGKEVKFVVGIAGAGDDHLKLLGKLAEVFVDREQVARLEAAQSPADVQAVLGAMQPA